MSFKVLILNKELKLNTNGECYYNIL